MSDMDRLRDLLQTAVGEPPHQVTAEAVHRRVIRRRVVECVAGAMAAAVIAAIALVGVRTVGHTPSPAPATRPHPTARIITSRYYHYAEALSAGWRLAGQATQRWDGSGSPGDYDPQSDLFLGPGGVEAWAYAAPAKEDPGGLHQNGHQGLQRRASMSGGHAVQPGHHDRRGTRPAAGWVQIRGWPTEWACPPLQHQA